MGLKTLQFLGNLFSRSARVGTTPRHTMEDFLAAVAQAMNDSELSAAELIGCLEIVKAELLETIFDDADEA